MVRSFDLAEKPRPVLHDEVAALARDLAGAKMALVSLVGSERNWFAGIANFAQPDQCRWTSFCTHVVADPENPLWIEDARRDFRFAHNSLVVSDPHLRFYAGIPILVNGYAVGSLCVMDSEPKPYNDRGVQRLTHLSKIVATDLADRHQLRSLRHSLLASADALIDCDDHGIITEWSEGAERVFGFTSAEAVGRNVNIIVPPDRVAAHANGFMHWRRSGDARLERRIELCALRKDGTSVEIELWMSVTHIDGIRHIHSNVRDISERKKHATELMSAKAEAEAANRAKSTFLTNMSHELRTPLNGVIGITELLTKTNLTEHQAELTSIIQSSSEQLRRLVGDILDLARVESGQLILAQEPMSLDEVVVEVTNLSAFAAQSKGLAVRTELAADVNGAVIGDALRLKQVLHNLVSNAVKFTETGAVTVSVRRQGEGFRFEVSDTGIGFTENQRSAIFERFKQADDSITREFGGTGLGLAISCELVACMGGELQCSAQVGKGAVFWFTLALPAAEDDKPCCPSVTTVPEAGRILVVDDNATNRRVAELLLNSVGADVLCVDDGQQAVEAFLRHRFDVILMDMMMPVMDGITATRAIRRIEVDQQLPRTPIFMLTANNLREHVEAGAEAGADLHLAKPIGAEALFAALGTLEEIHGSNRTPETRPLQTTG